MDVFCPLWNRSGEISVSDFSIVVREIGKKERYKKTPLCVYGENFVVKVIVQLCKRKTAWQ